MKFDLARSTRFTPRKMASLKKKLDPLISDNDFHAFVLKFDSRPLINIADADLEKSK